MIQQFKKGHLGRGLGSLIPDRKPAQNDANDFKGQPVGEDFSGRHVHHIKPEDIDANPYQPRTEFEEQTMEDLTASIKTHGILQPLLVTKKGSKYELIAGERRLRAGKNAGLREVPVIVIEADEKKKLELALIENLQREDLNPIETARSYRTLMDTYSLTQNEISKRLGKSRSGIANSLRFLMLPQEIQISLAKGEITEGHAKIIAGISSQEGQINLWNKIVRHKLTVRSTDLELKRQGIGHTREIASDPNCHAQEKAMEESLGTKVRIKKYGKKGNVEILFFTDEDLAEIVRKITA